MKLKNIKTFEQHSSELNISGVRSSNVTELPSGGRVIIKNHRSIPDGNYIFFKGQSGDYFVTLSYQDRHNTYRIGEETLKKYTWYTD